MTDQPSPPAPPPLNRPQMTSDLTAIGQAIGGQVAQAIHLPRSLVTSAISRACSRPLDLSDAELRAVIETAAYTLGVWYGVNPPAPLTADQADALRRLALAMGR